MRTLSTHKILLAMLIILLIAAPICFLLKTNADADITTQSATSHDGDYVFFVVEDSEVPLAAIPTVSHDNSIQTLVATVALVTLLVLATTYLAWYLTIRYNLYRLAQKLPANERSSFVLSNSYLHPLTAYRLSKEAEYSITRQYLY